MYSTGLIAYNRMISNLSTIVIDILEICAMLGCTYTTLCDKVCQWVATGRWLTPVSSTNKTDCYEMTEILLKVALSTTIPNQTKMWLTFPFFNIFSCNQFLLQFSMQIFLKLCTMLSHILKIFIWHCESHLSPLTYNPGLFIKFKTLHLLTFFSMSHLTYWAIQYLCNQAIYGFL